MSKRKRLRTSGEGVRPPKPPKNARLRGSDGAPHSFQLGPLHHPEESEGRSGPPPSVEHSGEEPGQVAPSSLGKEAEAPSRLLAQPEKEPIACPSSQNSVGRFVPQFAKPRKAVTRLAATREEDLGSEAFSLETPPEPSAQKAGSQSWEESPGLTVWEARAPGGQTPADGTHSKHSVQNPIIPMFSKGDSQSEVSSDISPEWGMVPLASERASQNYLLEQGTNLPGGGGTEAGGIPGDLSQKGHLPSSGAEEQEPDRGAPQEEGAQGGARVDQEKGDSILGLAAWGLEPGSAAQAPTDPTQTLRAGREAEGSCSSPRHPSLRITVITDVTIDPITPEQRALEVAGLGGKADTRAPASPNRKAPAGGHSEALLRGTPLTRETTGGRGEAGQEAEPPSEILGDPAASLALAYGIQEPTICARDSSPVASEMGPVVDQTGRDQEGLGDTCVLPLLSQTLGEKAAELGSQSHEQDLGGLSLCLGASAPLLHREAVDGPPRDARAYQGGPGAPTGPAGPPKHPPDSADQAVLEGFPTMEFDFLPDSQIKDALEATNFEAPNEQPCKWQALGTILSCYLLPEQAPLQRQCLINYLCTHKGIQPCEATRMEDATDTVRGLIVELSNLNRLIMNAHRDLEAFKRLNYRKANPAGKAPVSYTSKGAGTLPREQSWSDL